MPTSSPDPAGPAPVIVVGAGAAGLTCAVELVAAGREVIVLEATDGVGGRVRTDRHPDGYLLDRGFQVILEAYPALRRHVDLDPLRARPFDAGALVWTGRRLVPLADPFRHPAALPRDLSSPLLSTADKLRLASLGLRARLARWDRAAAAVEGADGAEDRTAAETLWAAGFDRYFVDRFARPFWGGILLDRSLSTSSGPLRFTLKMFLQGAAVLPKDGVGAVPERLARWLPSDVVRFHRPVDQIVVEQGRAVGVRAGGETIAGSAVVVATDPPAAKRLTGLAAIPETGVGCVTIYLTGDRDPGLGKRLALDGTGALAVNHLAPLSTVAPSYAPPGRHLLAAVILGAATQATDDEALARRARDDATAMLGHDPTDWTPLATVRVPFSQFAQPPGIYRRLPATITPTPGLYLAGEATVDSSLNGAIISGEVAARAVQRDERG